jgi:hypothetical protein
MGTATTVKEAVMLEAAGFDASMLSSRKVLRPEDTVAGSQPWADQA